MLQTLKIAPTADAAWIAAALARVSALTVALEWPLGSACAVASDAEMRALADSCTQVGREVVIIGGDEILRAHAVAAGFAAATSLEEWETAKQRAVKVDRHSRQTQPPQASGDEDQAIGPRLVAPAPAEDPHLYDLAGEDPPEYVAGLFAAQQDEPASERLAAITTVPIVARRPPTRADDIRREAAEAAAAERAQQAYEEHITATIRTTGALTGGGAAEDVVSEEDAQADGSVEDESTANA